MEPGQFNCYNSRVQAGTPSYLGSKSSMAKRVFSSQRHTDCLLAHLRTCWRAAEGKSAGEWSWLLIYLHPVLRLGCFVSAVTLRFRPSLRDASKHTKNFTFIVSDDITWSLELFSFCILSKYSINSRLHVNVHVIYRVLQDALFFSVLLKKLRWNEISVIYQCHKLF
jgi:hypothetical protein